MSKSPLRNFIVAVLLLLVALSGFGFMIFKINAQGALLVEQVKALDLAQQKDESYFRLQRVYDESASNRETLLSHFLQEESDSINFLNAIEANAKKLGVAMDDISLVTKKEKETKNDWLEVSFSLTGSEDAIQKFIVVLENLPYFSYVTSVRVVELEGQEWEANVTMQAQILSYEE